MRRLANHPELVTRASVIGAQEPKTVLERQLVFLDVLGRNFSPVVTDMAGKKFPRLLAGFFNRSQRAGRRNHTTECEERLHALVFSASAA